MYEDGVYLLAMKDADYGVPYTLKNQTNPDGSTFVLLAGVDGVKILSNLEPGYRLIRLEPVTETLEPHAKHIMIDAYHKASKEELRQFAARRRQALTHHGCGTYRLGIDHDGEPRSILCLCCGLQSFNANDIVYHYCGFCHEYHSEWIDFDFMQQG